MHLSGFLPRFTVRWLMIAVAVVAFSIGGWQAYRERLHRLRVAALCQRAAQGGNSYDLTPDTETLRILTNPSASEEAFNTTP